MKKLFLFVALFIGLVSFKTIIENNFTISGTASGIENGKKVFLERQDNVKGVFAIDTVTVLNGKFNFSGTTLEPAVHFIQVEGIQGKVALILENGKIGVTFYKDSVAKSKISGTKNNEDFQNFNATMFKVQNKMQNFQKINNSVINEAQAKKDTATINGLIKQYNQFQDEMIALTTTFPAKNPKSFLSVLIVDNMFNMPNSNIENIKAIYSGLDASLKSTKPGKAIQNKIANFKSFEIGSVAPEFSAPNPDGKMVSLKQSLGKITIIDFWSSWCGPCRKENPSVVQLYKDFHAKGLNIIGISLDKDAVKWKEAIAKDNLTWTHISNLKFWQDPIAELYNIKSIPATFILDANGKIIARDLRGDELRAKIASLLSK